MTSSSFARLIALILAIMTSTLAGCRSNESPHVDKSIGDLDRLVYVGCRVSLGECRNSCSNRDGRGYEDLKKCPEANLEGAFACYCGHLEPLPDDPDPELYVFIGCRPAPAECLNSCPSRQGVSNEHPQHCPVEAGEGAFACYCRK